MTRGQVQISVVRYVGDKKLLDYNMRSGVLSVAARPALLECIVQNARRSKEGATVDLYPYDSYTFRIQRTQSIEPYVLGFMRTNIKNVISYLRNKFIQEP